MPIEKNSKNIIKTESPPTNNGEINAKNIIKTESPPDNNGEISEQSPSGQDDKTCEFTEAHSKLEGQQFCEKQKNQKKVKYQPVLLKGGPAARHQDRHSNLKHFSFKCFLCDFVTFRSRPDLIKHIKTSHGISITNDKRELKTEPELCTDGIKQQIYTASETDIYTKK